MQGLSAAKEQLIADLRQRLQCAVVCVQETHRGPDAICLSIPGMDFVIERPHSQYGSAIGVRANIHLGGQTEFCPNGFSGGGGGSSRNFPGSIFSGGGGGSGRNFPGSIFCGVAEFFPLPTVTDPQFGFFPLTPVTDPKFVLFKHVLCFARIMLTLCPNSCRQTARIGGAAAPPAPPVPYAYGQCHICYVGHHREYNITNRHQQHRNPESRPKWNLSDVSLQTTR